MSGEAGARGSWSARRAWIGGIVGAAAVSVAMVAVLNERGEGPSSSRGSPAAEADGDEPAEEPGQMHWRHTYPESYTGPVWITVEVPDSRPRTITITWGAWRRHLVHEGADSATYAFTKGGGPSIPIGINVEPDAVITFGSGTPPAGSVDINNGWVENINP